MVAMHVRLDQGLERQLAAHAAAAAPREACGLLAGRRAGGGWHVHALVPLCNRSRRPDAFAIDACDYARADRAARLSGAAIAGVFHSHPRGPARPSPRDLAMAWTEHVQLIVGHSPAGPRLAAFAHDGATWVPVPVETRGTDAAP
jgi:proteasome lid subunit RPN8/RPN11